MKTISVIVPVYNEAKNIKILYDELLQTLFSLSNIRYEIIYINDGSQDETAAEIERIIRSDPFVRLVSLTRRFGLSAALAAGFDVAKGDVVISMDGDLQHDPKDISMFLDGLENGYDVVCGDRRDRSDEVPNRYLFSMVANYFGRLLFGMQIHDFSTTFRAYRSEVVKSLWMFNGAHRFIPVLAELKGFKVGETVITYRARQNGCSKVAVVPRIFKVIKDAFLIKSGWFFFLGKVRYEILYVR